MNTELLKEILNKLEDASTWSNYESEDAEWGIRHCCITRDWQSHDPKCGLQSLIKKVKEELKKS